MYFRTPEFSQMHSTLSVLPDQAGYKWFKAENNAENDVPRDVSVTGGCLQCGSASVRT